MKKQWNSFSLNDMNPDLIISADDIAIDDEWMQENEWDEIYAEKRESVMATQIAPTPTIRGEDARKILAEANTKRTSTSQANAEKLMQKFGSKVKHK